MGQRWPKTNVGKRLVDIASGQGWGKEEESVRYRSVKMTDKLTSTERLQSQMSSSNADSELVGFISSEFNHLPPTVCLEFSHLWKQGGRQPLKQPLQQQKKSNTTICLLPETSLAQAASLTGSLTRQATGIGQITQQAAHRAVSSTHSQPLVVYRQQQIPW